MDNNLWIIIPGLIGFLVVFFAPIILSLTQER